MTYGKEDQLVELS